MTVDEPSMTQAHLPDRSPASERPSLLRRMWDLFTAPHESIAAPEVGRRARLVSAALLALLVVDVIELGLAEVGWLITIPPELLRTAWAIWALAVVVYALSRTRYYRTTAISLTTLSVVAAALLLMAAPDLAFARSAAVMSLIAPMLAAILLGAVAVTAVTCGCVVGLVAFSQLATDLSPAFVATVVMAHLTTATLMFTLLYLRRRDLQDVAHAQAQAERASQIKGEFLAVMSHELRTPMNGVVGTVDLLCDSELDSDSLELAGIARSSAATMMALINDVLDFSRLDGGQLQLEDGVVDLRAIIEDVVQAAANAGLSADVVLQPVIELGGNEYFRGDGLRVRQIVANLVSNAVKFTHQGQIEVAAYSRDEGGCVLEVVDTGIGIDAERVHALFAPFVQADSSTTRRYGGSGLGLAICRKLASHMGGTIVVQSELGSGSTFRVTLPLERCAAPGRVRDPVSWAPMRLYALDLPALSVRALRSCLTGTELITVEGPDDLSEHAAAPVVTHDSHEALVRRFGGLVLTDFGTSTLCSDHVATLRGPITRFALQRALQTGAATPRT